MPSIADLHRRLLQAIRAGDPDQVSEVLFSVAGTGLACQRLALLDFRARNGMCAEDVAGGLNDGSEARAAILRLLSAERGRMEFFE